MNNFLESFLKRDEEEKARKKGVPMSLPLLTEEAIKSRAKAIRELFKKEFEKDVPHGQCLKIVSQLFGFDNWNTAKAVAARVENERPPTEKPLDGYVNKEAAIAFLVQRPDVSVVIQRPYEIDISWGPDEPDGGGGGAHYEHGVDETTELSYRIEPESKRLIIEVPQETNIEYVGEHWKRTVESEKSYPPPLDSEKIETRKLPTRISDEEIQKFTIEEFKEIIQEIPGYSLVQNGEGLTLKIEREFILDTEITNYRHNEDGDMAEYYGVVLYKDGMGGFAIDKSQSHNVEGFVDDLKQRFRETTEQRTMRQILPWGFTNQISQWESSNELSITATIKFSDKNFIDGLRKLTDEKANEAGDRYISFQTDLKRGK